MGAILIQTIKGEIKQVGREEEREEGRRLEGKGDWKERREGGTEGGVIKFSF